jgi:hypothetical protein
MNILDIRKCANFFRVEYLEKFYIVTTYGGNSFILIGEKSNFPHLMGISKNTYKSNGYKNPAKLYTDIINDIAITKAIIPNNIAPNSYIYNKAINFDKSTDIFWHNEGPLAVNYNSSLSSTRLDNVDILLMDLKIGYMMGWVQNKDVQISSVIKLKKYCISSWIDESNGKDAKKQKYMPSQDIDIIKSVLAFNYKSELVREKKYTYEKNQKIDILKAIESNGSNLVIDNRNAVYYVKLASSHGIHCKINNIQY